MPFTAIPAARLSIWQMIGFAWLRFSLLFAAAILLLGADSVPPSTLRAAGDQSHMPVGTAVRPSLFSEAAYSETLAREFNMVEPEDAFKWQVVRSDPGTFDFRDGG